MRPVAGEPDATSWPQQLAARASPRLGLAPESFAQLTCDAGRLGKRLGRRATATSKSALAWLFRLR
jgi:hypothetical protein